MKAVVFTLGCKTNRYESDAMAETLRRAGYEVSDRLEDADLFIVNTCAVTAEAERKSRQAIARVKAKNPGARVYVCGCASEKSPEIFLKKCVSGAIGVAGKNELAETLARVAEARPERCRSDRNAPPGDDGTSGTFRETPRIRDGKRSDGNAEDASVGNREDGARTSGKEIFFVSEEKSGFREKNSEAVGIFTDGRNLRTPDATGGGRGNERMSGLRKFPDRYEEFSVPPAVGRTRAELKIQDGCDNYCSYCVIPYLRGRSRSRTVGSVVREAEYLDGKTGEIVLTGINLSAYGQDLGTDLPSLVAALRGIEARIRLGSFYVEGVTDALLDALGGLKRFCPHFHLSLQSGDDAVLRSMNRKYGTDDYRRAVEKIRAAFPNAGLTTDVIAGYPTETEEAAARTLRFLEEIGFSDLHVFVFSKREGTTAARLPELPRAVREARKERLLALKSKLKRAFLQQNLGVRQEVLFEETIGGEEVGYSENYLRVYRERAGLKNTDFAAAVVPKILYKDGLK